MSPLPENNIEENMFTCVCVCVCVLPVGGRWITEAGESRGRPRALLWSSMDMLLPRLHRLLWEHRGPDVHSSTTQGWMRLQIWSPQDGPYPKQTSRCRAPCKHPQACVVFQCHQACCLCGYNVDFRTLLCTFKRVPVSVSGSALSIFLLGSFGVVLAAALLNSLPSH